MEVSILIEEIKQTKNVSQNEYFDKSEKMPNGLQFP